MKKFTLSLLTISFLLIFSMRVSADIYPRTDTLYIQEISEVPVIDGDASDAIWDNQEWVAIDQVWMPWGNEAANLDQEDGLELYDGADDFTGNFKVVWSSETDLLYFLVETTDDVFVDGYLFPDGGYPNYDIVEIFIDENRSGGLHVFDGTGSTGESWGTNAENAFSYHIAANAPAEGEIQTDFFALDIAGSGWSDPRVDYASHFPEFTMSKNGNTFIWEFSMQVHDDTYIPEDEAQSVIELNHNKILGLTLAYCDNDDPTHIQREHFFGSVFVPEENYNDHWKQADYFGVAKLVEAQSSSVDDILSLQENAMIRAWSAGENLEIEYESQEAGTFTLQITDLSGRELISEEYNKSDKKWVGNLSVIDFHQGIYIINIVQNNSHTTQKVLIR